jgi:hypothetical protein
MAYSGAADYSSGAPDVGFWEGGDPLWVSVLVAVCVLALIAVAECTGSVCSRRQSSRVEPTPRTPAGTPSRRRRLRRQNEMTTIKLNNEDQHAEIVTLRGTHVEVVLDRSPEGQHRLWWGLAGDRSKRVGSFRVGKPAEPQTAVLRIECDGKPCELRAGSCVLQRYPECELIGTEETGGWSVTRELEKNELPVLEELVLLLLEDRTTAPTDPSLGSPLRHGSLQEPSDRAPWWRLSNRRDDFGACPIHALLLANTEASLRLCKSMFRRRPKLLTLTHCDKGDKGEDGRHQFPMADFNGEGCLHIAAVNLREPLLCEMLDRAPPKLPPLERPPAAADALDSTASRRRQRRLKTEPNLLKAGATAPPRE